VTTFTSNGIDDNADAVAITIDSSENVGIGTTAPTAPLHVNSSSHPQINLGGASPLYYWGLDREASAGDLQFSNANNSAASVRMTLTAGGLVGIGTTAPSVKLAVIGDVYLGDSASTSDGALTIGSSGAGSVVIKRTGTGATNSSMTFSTTFSTLGERMRIDGQGNVGIGTASPAYPLTLGNNKQFGALNTGGSAVTLAILNGSNNLVFGDDSANTGNLTVQSRAETKFILNGAERARITSTGNVGIGTTAPATYGTLAVAVAASSLPVLGMSVTGSSPLLNHYITDSGSTVRTLNQIVFGTGSTSSANYQGYLAFKTASAAAVPAERMRIDAAGNLLVGTTSQVDGSRLSIYGGSIGGLGFASSLVSNVYSISIDSVGGLTTRKDSADFWYLGRSGSANCVSNNGAWVDSSDQRLKENIETLPDALNKVCSLRGVSFNRIASGKPEIGLIAQEVQDIYPDVVETGGDYLGLHYGALVGPLVEAIKEQQAMILALTTRITALEG
jgi:hypothetical protein